MQRIVRTSVVLLVAIVLVGDVVSQEASGDSRFNVVSVSGSVRSKSKAESLLKFPEIIPTLYGNMLFDFRPNNELTDKRTGKEYEYILQTPTDDQIKIWSTWVRDALHTVRLVFLLRACLC